MPEQQQWSERTLDMPPQDPWSSPQHGTTAFQPPANGTTAFHGPAGDPTAHAGPAGGTTPFTGPGSFTAGRAQVNPAGPRRQYVAEHEPTGTGWPDAPPPPRSVPRDLRRGGGWTTAAVCFLVVCWGIWAIASSGSFVTAGIVLALSLVVAAGLFVLARLVGRILWERLLGRVRRSARGAHAVAAVFLIGVAVAFLRETTWVMTAVHWVTGLFN